jgi:hypothetical protein
MKDQAKTGLKTLTKSKTNFISEALSKASFKDCPKQSL